MTLRIFSWSHCAVCFDSWQNQPKKTNVCLESCKMHASSNMQKFHVLFSISFRSFFLFCFAQRHIALYSICLNKYTKDWEKKNGNSVKNAFMPLDRKVTLWARCGVDTLTQKKWMDCMKLRETRNSARIVHSLERWYHSFGTFHHRFETKVDNYNNDQIITFYSVRSLRLTQMEIRVQTAWEKKKLTCTTEKQAETRKKNNQIRHE